MAATAGMARQRLDYDAFRGSQASQARWQYVEVEASILPSGFVAPKCLTWPDGRRFEIDRVTLCRYNTLDSTWYYEVQIRGQAKQLWYRHGAFFVLVEQGGSLHGAEPPAHNSYELRKRYGFRA